MRIIDAEPQLIKDFIDEIKIIETKKKPSTAVYVGRHPTLGKVVLVENKTGDSFIVEVDE